MAEQIPVAGAATPQMLVNAIDHGHKVAGIAKESVLAKRIRGLHEGLERTWASFDTIQH